MILTPDRHLLHALSYWSRAMFQALEDGFFSIEKTKFFGFWFFPP